MTTTTMTTEADPFPAGWHDGPPANPYPAGTADHDRFEAGVGEARRAAETDR